MTGERVRVFRGGRGDPDADRAATASMLARTADDGVPALRVWRPGRQVAFGRRDASADGYERARRAARERGFPPAERSVGGRAVAYADSTLAFAHAVPSTDARSGIGERYDDAIARVVAGLRATGADVTPGEPPDAYCPGDHSVRIPGGGKVAGVAQRVRQDVALVGGCVTVAEREALRDVLDPVYDALGVAFDPDAVGSVAAAGGPTDPAPVREELEAAFRDDRVADIHDVTDLSIGDD